MYNNYGEVRVLFFGTKIALRRLTAALHGEKVDIVSPSQATEAITRLKRGRFDLVIIDSSLPETDTIWRRIKSIKYVPVALLVNKPKVDWQRLNSLDVNGYIPLGTKGTELLARLRAVARRSSLNGVQK